MNTLLIVEDEKMIRQGIKTMIQRSGVPVDTILECNNGQSAYEMLQSQKIDVMFTDIRMPKMDGIELVSAVQALPHRPLIVAVSGYDDFSYAVEMLRGGVREYILKPVERDKVKAILETFQKELLQREAQEAELRSIGKNQLKYVMTSDVTRKEMQMVAEWFEEMPVSKDYYILCTQMQEVPEASGEKFMYWKDIEKSSVYIIVGTEKERFLKEELSGCHTGISRRYQGMEYLKAAYKEAKAARKEAFCTGRYEVNFEEIRTDADKPNTEKMRQIAQQIGTSRIEESLTSIRQIVKDTKRKKYSAVTFEEDILSLIDSVVGIYQNVMQQAAQEAERFKDIYSFPDIDSFTEEFTGWLMEFHDRLDEEFDDYKNKQKMQEAIGFIEENFDKDLNMAVVSNHVSMNYSLFSYVFKQYTGRNFVNYLKEFRVEEAKKLLAQTEMRVVEISKKVGYENEKHFMKIFRNVCGVSPTEYRKNMQAANNL